MVFSQMTFASAASKVIFNQNAYRTFVDWPPEMDVRHSPYGRPDLLAVLTGSLDNQRYLQTAFPGLPVLRARYSIDLELFHGRSEKERLIAYMPRKNRRESTQVLVQLQLRGALAGWTVVPVEGVTEVEVADVLRRASVFLSFGHPEGFGLPPVEAMRCGCVVIGYHGLGGREYFRPPHAYPIPFGDIRQYVETVEQLLGALETDPRPLHERAAAASELVAREYPPERQIEEVLDAWRELLDARAAGRPVEARRDPESGAPAAGASPA